MAFNPQKYAKQLNRYGVNVPDDLCDALHDAHADGLVYNWIFVEGARRILTEKGFYPPKKKDKA